MSEIRLYRNEDALSPSICRAFWICIYLDAGEVFQGSRLELIQPRYADTVKIRIGLRMWRLHTLAAADRKFVELGALIILGRAAPEPEPVRYTIPAPMRGLRLVGVVGSGCDVAPDGSLSADDRAKRDGVAEIEGKLALLLEAARPLAVCEEARDVVVDALRIDGARKLLWDDLEFDPGPCASRRGRGADI